MLVTLQDGRKALVLQAMGRLFMDPLDCPFRGTADMLSKYRLGASVQAIVADFHAEASSEKMAYAPCLRRPGVVRRRHPHPLPDRRRPDPAGRHGISVRRRHVRRLRQRDRHGEGRAPRCASGARCRARSWARRKARQRSAACSLRPTTPPDWHAMSSPFVLAGVWPDHANCLGPLVIVAYTARI